MIQFDLESCTNFDQASSREWLETNGIGGFASGTVSGANTRRYHALLTAATRPPLGRVSMLSKFEETLFVGDERFELSSDQYPGRVDPSGYKFLTGFRLDPFPTWTYSAGGVAVEKRIFMVNGSHATVCRWQLKGSVASDVRLELRPLLSFVDYHHLQHEDKRFETAFQASVGAVAIRPYEDFPALHFGHNAIDLLSTGHWYHNFEYAIEKERGFDHHEDLYQPFCLVFDLSRTADVIVSTDPLEAAEAEAFERSELQRRESVISNAGVSSEFAMRLVLAADQFIVARDDGHTVIAGYPWFSDWGRDTMIALPGLTLATGRHEVARSIILEFAKHISEGMLPNRFPDAGDEADYNTVDATLWYFEAIRAYLDVTDDEETIRGLYIKLAEIVAMHVRGTRFNIHLDTDGLLYAGEPGDQLTWMDAKIGDLVITPRTGKPVEIQALWYNALRIMSDLAGRFGHKKDKVRFDAMADLAKLSFNGLFWNDDEKCLFDVVENGDRDASVRPNQIFAVSLANPILDESRWAAVVAKVETHLLTPYGLRSLSPKDRNYVAVYKGSPFERDSAYHQGAVWGWLIGPYVDAFRRVNAKAADREDRVSEKLSAFEHHLSEAGLSQVSEIFDGASPHAPRGSPAQAWSVAELLRVSKSA